MHPEDPEHHAYRLEAYPLNLEHLQHLEDPEHHEYLSCCSWYLLNLEHQQHPEVR